MRANRRAEEDPAVHRDLPARTEGSLARDARQCSAPGEVPDPQQLGLPLSVNGQARLDSHSGNLIFGVSYLIWYLSQYLMLEPGDLINTGTPAGVAFGWPDRPCLKPADRVALEIDGLGRVEQCSVAVN